MTKAEAIEKAAKLNFRIKKHCAKNAPFETPPKEGGSSGRAENVP